MEYSTIKTQMKIAQLLHESCDFTYCTKDDQCPGFGSFVVKSAFFLGKLLPFIIQEIIIPTRKDEDQRIGQRIIAELVCCDIHERLEAEAAKGRWDDESHQYLMPKSWYALKRSKHYHAICHFGGWAASIARSGVGRRYWCPSSGELELNEGGGFQTCCDNPEGHIFMAPEPEEEEA